MRRWMALCAACTLALVGCTSAEKGAPSAATATRTTSPSPVATQSDCDSAPFTGEALQDATPEPLVAVKVENSYNARPQSGLEDADIVFVELVEGGETRFVALFNSQIPDVVGPIRSIRPTDAGILGQWAGDVSLFYSGGVAAFVNQVKDAGVSLYTEEDAGFYRDNSRWAPHNLYASMGAAVATVEQPSDCIRGLFTYTANDSHRSGGLKVSAVTVSYPAATSGWAWNESAGEWDRSDDGAATASNTSGHVLSATNVVVMHVQAHNLSVTDVAGAPVPETVLVGKGNVDYFVAGYQYTGKWEKSDINAHFEFTDSSGETFALDPGNTWVELLPQTGTLTAQ